MISEVIIPAIFIGVALSPFAKLLWELFGTKRPMDADELQYRYQTLQLRRRK